MSEREEAIFLLQQFLIKFEKAKKLSSHDLSFVSCFHFGDIKFQTKDYTLVGNSISKETFAKKPVVEFQIPIINRRVLQTFSEAYKSKTDNIKKIK